MKKIKTKKEKSGFYHWYMGKKDVTYEWMWFFSGLSHEQEKDAEKLFIKYYEKL
jgi:hypothetical protein